jgi:hypothetical protein
MLLALKMKKEGLPGSKKVKKVNFGHKQFQNGKVRKMRKI